MLKGSVLAHFRSATSAHPINRSHRSREHYIDMCTLGWEAASHFAPNRMPDRTRNLDLQTRDPLGGLNIEAGRSPNVLDIGIHEFKYPLLQEKVRRFG